MKHLTIVVPSGKPNQISVLGTYMLLNRAEKYWRDLGHPPVFNIVLAGISREPVFYNGLFSIHPQVTVQEIDETGFIIITALQPEIDYTETVKLNRPLIEWVMKQYKLGAEVASICTGAFLLASTGIVNGRNCSTHWWLADSFRNMFPEVHLVQDKIITDESGVYSSGGAFSFLNFILYLVEKYYDRQTAVYCAKIFEIDMDRNSQSPFEVFRGQKNHEDEVIKKAQVYLENNFREKISVENLAFSLSVGRRNFDRRFRKVTGNTPLEYLQRLKIESAKKSFENTRKNISEVMYEVGYSDLKAFRNLFRKITGLSPLEYRNKYNKEAIFLNK